MRRALEWSAEGNGVWIARTSRDVGRRYKISVRHLQDGDVFDVHRLVRNGPDAWRPSYLGSGTSLERAQGIALANYQRLRTPGNWEEPVKEHIIRRARS